MNIIIVDDDSLVSGALKTILEINEDVTVIATGSDGQEACDLYRRYQPDILLMDIRMKNMSGLEASSAILQAISPGKDLTTYHLLRRRIYCKSSPTGRKRLSAEAGLF